jgi:4-aminobutyrate aminotransferase-like enzyme
LPRRDDAVSSRGCCAGAALQISPPFVISAAELHQVTEVLTAALDAESP